MKKTEKAIITCLAVVFAASGLTGCGTNNSSNREESVLITDTPFNSPEEDSDAVQTDAPAPSVTEEDALSIEETPTENNSDGKSDIINSDNLQFLDLLSHLADTDDPFDFGKNFTDNKEWIVDPADIDDNYDWKKRLDTIGGRPTIGNDELGHIEIPAVWAEYRKDDPNIIEYRDVSGKEVVTLTKVPCTNGNTFEAFYSTYQICRNDPTCQIVCTYKSQIEGRECYRIDIHFDTTETYLSAWVTEGGDDFCYFLSLEVSDIYNTELARTYTLPKK